MNPTRKLNRRSFLAVVIGGGAVAGGAAALVIGRNALPGRFRQRHHRFRHRPGRRRGRRTAAARRAAIPTATSRRCATRKSAGRGPGARSQGASGRSGAPAQCRRRRASGPGFRAAVPTRMSAPSPMPAGGAAPAPTAAPERLTTSSPGAPSRQPIMVGKPVEREARARAARRAPASRAPAPPRASPRRRRRSATGCRPGRPGRGDRRFEAALGGELRLGRARPDRPGRARRAPAGAASQRIVTDGASWARSQSARSCSPASNWRALISPRAFSQPSGDSARLTVTLRTGRAPFRAAGLRAASPRAAPARSTIGSSCSRSFRLAKRSCHFGAHVGKSRTIQVRRKAP